MAIALLSTAACEGSDDGRSPPAEATPSAAPVPGGRVVVGVFGEPATLDPQSPLASDLTFALARPLYRSLYRFDAEGTAVPDLAASVTPSGDGARLELREAFWDDGRPITSRDVVFSIRNAHPRSGLSEIRSVTRRGDALLLAGDVDDWEDALARLSFVLPADGRRAFSGPFRLASRTEGLQVVLRRNPRAETPPLLDRLTVQFTEGLDMLLGLLDRKRIDVAWLPSSLNLDQRLDELGLEYEDHLGWEQVLIDLSQSGLDAATRKAVASALDRGAIERGFVRDDGRVSDTLAPGPGPGGASGRFEAVFRGGGRDAGDGSSLTVGAPAGDELLELTQRMLQVQLDAAGFDVELINVDAKRFYGEWSRSSPLDLALTRRGGAPGIPGRTARGTLQELPLFHVETVIAWTRGVGGVEVNGGLEGPLWNAEGWFVDGGGD